MTPRNADPVSYLLRNVDAQLWATFKARAEDEGIQMRDALLSLIDGYVTGDVAIQRRATMISRAQKAANTRRARRDAAAKP